MTPHRWMSAACLLATAAVADPAVPGFEPVLQTNLEWTAVWARDRAAVKAEPDTQVRHEAPASLRITHTGAADWAVTPEVRFAAAPGDLVEASAWIQVQGNGTAGISFIFRTPDGKVVQWSAGARRAGESARWSLVRCRTLVPPGVVGVAPRVTGTGPATVWMEGARFRRLARTGREPQAARTIENAAIRLSLDPSTAGLTLTDLRTGTVWSPRKAVDAPWIVTESGVDGRGIAATLVDLSNDLVIRVRAAVDAAKPEVTVSLDATGPLQGSLAWPPAFETAAGQRLIVPMNEGISYPVDDPAVTPMRLVAYGGHGICMAFFGVTAGETGLLSILETPDDAGIRIERPEGGRLAIAPEWVPQRGTFGYGRRLRLVAIDRGGYVAMCKRYREHARQTGLLKPFVEKRRDRPAIDKLAGAANVWFMDGKRTDMGKALVDAGMTRVLWSAGGASNELAELNALGFLTSRYDIYQDCMDPEQFGNVRGKHGDWTSEAWPTGIVIRANGDWERGWQVKGKDGSMIPCGVLCDRLASDWARQRIGEELKSKPFLGRFIDTTTASPWRECYATNHPMTRTESRRFKTELLRVISGEFKLVCGSETGHDAVVPVADFFEGMLSLGPYRVPDSGRDTMRKWDEVPEKVARFQTGFGYRLPLWELVYHDCCVAQWYWGDYNNKLPSLWDRRDLWNALYGTPPMYMFNRVEWERDRERFIRSYRTSTPVAARTMMHPMTDHRWLAADGSVQQSTFGDGTVVTVNFGDRPFRLADGRDLGPVSSDIRPDKP
ncbi:MAG: hypothetical protein KJ579_08220 [Verrucomicrobia bacterium]|nr:hypothetical protein [Verrucomicrobiota bacterium]